MTDYTPTDRVNCDSKMENVLHLFVKCSISEECWQMQGLWDDIQSPIYIVNSFKDLLLTFF